MDNNYQINVVDRARETLILIMRSLHYSLVLRLITSLSKPVCLASPKAYSVQLILSRMFSIHPCLFSYNQTSLLAVHSDRVLYSIFNDDKNDINGQIYSPLNAFVKDIFTIKLIVEQKKEVTDCEMTRKHCKTFQYFKKLPN